MTTPRTSKPAPARTRGKPQKAARKLKLRNGLARFSVEMPPALVERIERSGEPDALGRRPSRNVQIAALCQWALDRMDAETKKIDTASNPAP